LRFAGDKDPLNASSRKKCEKLLEEMKQACISFVQSEIKTMLQDSFQAELAGEKWSLKPEAPQSLRFYYPQLLAFSILCVYGAP
jgi:hypothetical protein